MAGREGRRNGAGARAKKQGGVRHLEDGPTHTLDLAAGPRGGFRITCKVCGRTSAGATYARLRYCPYCRQSHPVLPRRPPPPS